MHGVKALALLALASAVPAHALASPPSTRAGIGGAGAFIAPAHVNGPFGAGGELAGIGGAGAFIVPSHVKGHIRTGGDLAAGTAPAPSAHSIAAAMGDRAGASAAPVEEAHLSPIRGSRVIAIHGDWTGRAPGPAGEIEVGESHNAGTVAAGIAAAEASAQPADPPPWSVCEHRDHAAAADLGPLLPVDYEPPDEVKAVLLGHVAVGTDCSVYDLPV